MQFPAPDQWYLIVFKILNVNHKNWEKCLLQNNSGKEHVLKKLPFSESVTVENLTLIFA